MYLFLTFHSFQFHEDFTHVRNSIKLQSTHQLFSAIISQAGTLPARVEIAVRTAMKRHQCKYRYLQEVFRAVWSMWFFVRLLICAMCCFLCNYFSGEAFLAARFFSTKSLIARFPRLMTWKEPTKKGHWKCFLWTQPEVVDEEPAGSEKPAAKLDFSDPFVISWT